MQNKTLEEKTTSLSDAVRDFMNERRFKSFNELASRHECIVLKDPFMATRKRVIEQLNEKMQFMIDVYEQYNLKQKDTPKDNLESLVKEMFEALEKGQTIKSKSIYHYALKGFFSDAKQK